MLSSSFRNFLQKRTSRLRHNRVVGETFPEDFPSDVHPEYFGGSYIETRADNSCFFNAIVLWYILIYCPDQKIDQNGNDFQSCSFHLRCEIANLIERFPKLLLWSGDTIKKSIEIDEKTTVPMYSQQIRKRSQWAGLIEIEVASIVLRVNIIVFQLNPNTHRLETRMCSFVNQHSNTIYLWLNGWANNLSSHFSLLWRSQNQLHNEDLILKPFFPMTQRIFPNFSTISHELPTSVLQNVGQILVCASGNDWIDFCILVLKQFLNIQLAMFVNSNFDQTTIDHLSSLYMKQPKKLKQFRIGETIIGLENVKTKRKIVVNNSWTYDSPMDFKKDIFIIWAEPQNFTLSMSFAKIYLLTHENNRSNLLLNSYQNTTYLYQINSN